MRFTHDNQPSNKGRPKGTLNKRSQFSNELTSKALLELEVALNSGEQWTVNSEQWAVESILKRTHPALKPITLDNSLDGEFLKLKMLEISEFEERIKALEERNSD